MHLYTPQITSSYPAFCPSSSRVPFAAGTRSLIDTQNKCRLGDLAHMPVMLTAGLDDTLSRNNRTERHPLNILFIFIRALRSDNVLLFPCFSKPTGTLNSHLSCVIFEGDLLAPGWSHCEVFGLGFLWWSRSDQSLQFLQRVFFGYWYWLIMAQNKETGCLVPKAVSLATLW